METASCFPSKLQVAPEFSLNIRWHLCSDYSLMAILGCYCCVSSKHPCLFCFWQRSDGPESGTLRDFQAAEERAGIAEQLAAPLLETSSKVSSRTSIPVIAIRIVVALPHWQYLCCNFAGHQADC